MVGKQADFLPTSTQPKYKPLFFFFYNAIGVLIYVYYI